VELMIVSKTQSIAAIAEAYQSPHRLFGENRVQELIEKVPALPSGIEWHVIGPVQRNKIRKAVGLVTCIHTVESLAQLLDIERIAGEEGRKIRVCLQVNIGSDPAKHGFSAEQVRLDLERCPELHHVTIDGLMTIPPLVDDPELSRPHFAGLRELRDELALRTGRPLATLSMGMSGDYAVAIQEGATIVRVGSAIFGERPSPTTSDAPRDAA
jgi:PLP dependent protein